MVAWQHDTYYFLETLMKLSNDWDLLPNKGYIVQCFITLAKDILLYVSIE